MNGFSAFIAKILAVLLSFFYMLAGGNADNTELRILFADESTVEYEIANYTGRTLNADKRFTVEKKNGDDWIVCTFADGFGIEEIISVVPNCRSVRYRIDLLSAFGQTLADGEYRLTIPCTGKSAVFRIG